MRCQERNVLWEKDEIKLKDCIDQNIYNEKIAVLIPMFRALHSLGMISVAYYLFFYQI
jgi:hypothetical protein